MKTETNHGKKEVYSLISSYEKTFVLYLDNEQDETNLFISPPIHKDQLLRAVFFVLIMRNEWLNENIEKEALKIFDDLQKKFKQYFKTTNQSLSKTKNENKDIPHSSKEGSIVKSMANYKKVIGFGRTCFVVKTLYAGEWLALKMVNVFKHEKGALEELKNEKMVLEALNKKAGLNS